MSEHVLTTMARRMTGDEGRVAQVTAVAARVQAALDTAVAEPDPARARGLLPAALRTLYVEVQPLVGQGLLPGSVWIDAQHARLYTRAAQLFGPGQRVVSRPSVEPLQMPGRGPGLFPR